MGKYSRFQLDTEKLLELLEGENLSLGDYALAVEMENSPSKTREEIIGWMGEVLSVMENASDKGREQPVNSVSGLTGGDAFLYQKHIQSGASILGKTASIAAARALSCGEWNASMQRVAACPTAGSCGIVPGVLLSLEETYKKTRNETVKAMFSASAIGILIGSKATLAGAEGGCQAECGAAAAMAAAATVEFLGGSQRAAMHAAAMAMKNLMGLVCDPVAGLVEIPCIKRNAGCTAIALLAADMALSGVTSRIPLGEVIDAMGQVGRDLPGRLKETAKGGIAVTPTALRLEAALKEK